MSDALINLEELPLQKYGEETFEKLSKSGDWLPQLRLYGSNNDVVKEGKFEMGHYGLTYNKDQIVDLSPEVSILVIAERAFLCIIK